VELFTNIVTYSPRLLVKATLMLDMMSKFEARNQKHETSPNGQNPKFKTKRKKDLVFDPSLTPVVITFEIATC